MEVVISLVISLILTAFIYGLGPLLLLAFHHAPISPKKLKWFHIIYTIVISLVFNFVSSMSGNGVSFTPAVIWGLIFYNINKSQFAKRVPAIPQEQQEQQEAQMKQFVVDESTGEVISEPEEPEPEPHKEPPAAPQKPAAKSYKPLCIVLAILLAASVVGNAAQGYLSVNSKEKTEIAKLTKELDSCNETLRKVRESRSIILREKNELQDELDERNRRMYGYIDDVIFLNNSIGMIVDGSKYYHNYHCPVFEAADEFWAHNIEYCQYLGYTKCPICYSDDFSWGD